MNKTINKLLNDLSLDATTERIQIVQSWSDELLRGCYIDEIFDIYTRKGFEFILSKVEDPFKVYLLDFVGISRMNDRLGYLEVNDRFRKLFNELKVYNLEIGRCFSGDEILIGTYELDKRYGIIIREHSLKYELDYKYTKSIYTKEQDIKKFIDKLTHKI